MCNNAVDNRLYLMLFVPEHFKATEMCNVIMRIMPEAFHHIPDPFKTQEMCDRVMREDPSSLIYAPDWFVRQQQVSMWCDDHYNDDDYDEIIEWYNGYQKSKA